MWRKLAMLAAMLTVATLLVTGTQTITGYYSDPDGYGYHHAEIGFFSLSLAVMIVFCILILGALGAIRRRSF